MVDCSQARQTAAVTGAIEKGSVTVAHGAAWLARIENGAMGTFDVASVAGGDQELSGFQINGSEGSLWYDYHVMT